MGRSLYGLIAASIATVTLSLPAAAADTIKIGLVNEASGANA